MLNKLVTTGGKGKRQFIRIEVQRANRCNVDLRIATRGERSGYVRPYVAMNDEADAIVRAMNATLPQGLLDRIAVRMIERLVSDLWVTRDESKRQQRKQKQRKRKQRDAL
jgi:hypothetical protein